eukprot:TRINITY_DN37481_c0_g1_i1.p1 TRINITY_DN37481_c0_g1~~TRINITY_DN37481_c0_g1_i1.p1  ORF type:complete len:303 (+),score=49.80 TRINITY_DN37481_c0_g1_i1:54-962(+)
MPESNSRLALRCLALCMCAGTAASFLVELRDPRRGTKVTALGCVSKSTQPDSQTLMVFAHGFHCESRNLDCPDYLWLCSTPGLAVAVHAPSDHSVTSAEVGLDIAFLSEELLTMARRDPDFPLHGKLNGAVVIGGHADGAAAAVAGLRASGAAAGLVLIAARGDFGLPPPKPLVVLGGQFDCGASSVESRQAKLFQDAPAERKAIIVAAGADHCNWVTAHKGACAEPYHADCGILSRAEQHVLGSYVIARFADAVSGDKWSVFEQVLDKGEAAGRWTYATHQSPDKALLSGCPCTQTSEEAG